MMVRVTAEQLRAWIDEKVAGPEGQMKSMAEMGITCTGPILKHQTFEFVHRVRLAKTMADRRGLTEEARRDLLYLLVKGWASCMVGFHAPDFISGGYDVLIGWAIEELEV